VGVDVLIQKDAIVVVEINPRLTTSYVGLHRASGCNPARLVVDMLYNKRSSWPRIIERNVVKVYV
jgi:predicted ATP-grasp superfamily ATP-dependent carboligase